MKTKANIVIVAMLLLLASSCAQESKKKDRSEATDMFRRITALTRNYTSRLSEATDSASWAEVCKEFEDSLDKINFSYPPDTDLLMTEGQNDTIHEAMLAYIDMREKIIHDILRPALPVDSLQIDSLEYDAGGSEVASIPEDASHNPGN